MNSFRLLCAASCAAVLACAGVIPALAGDAPIVIDTVRSDDLSTFSADDISGLLYLSPALSIFAGSAYAPELGAGIKLRGIGDPRLNLSFEGSAALYQPGSAQELWIGSRVGFTLDDVSKIEIVGSSSVGLIAGTPSYRLGLGGEVPVLPNLDVFAEGVIGGHFGFSPTDNGVRFGVHFFPGR